MFAMVIALLLLMIADDDLNRIDEAAARAHAAMPSPSEYQKQIAKSLRDARLQLRSAKMRKDKQSLDFLERQVEKLESIIKAKTPPKPEIPIFEGRIGRPMNESVFVVQVISTSEAIVKILTPPPRATFVEMWLHAPTEGWTDKATVSFDRPVMITGTKQYDTALGSSRTIREARVWTKEEIARFNNWRPAPKNDTKKGPPPQSNEKPLQ